MAQPGLQIAVILIYDYLCKRTQCICMYVCFYNPVISKYYPTKYAVAFLTQVLLLRCVASHE